MLTHMYLVALMTMSQLRPNLRVPATLLLLRRLHAHTLRCGACLLRLRCSACLQTARCMIRIGATGRQSLCTITLHLSGEHYDTCGIKGRAGWAGWKVWWQRGHARPSWQRCTQQLLHGDLWYAALATAAGCSVWCALAVQVGRSS